MELQAAHDILLQLTTAATVALFLGLAIYVLKSNSKRPISRLFSFLCLTIANIYLSSFFMAARPEPVTSLAYFFLHWKWIAITLSATVFLHFVFYYFPAGWQPYRLWILVAVYLISAGLILIIATADALISGQIHTEPPHVIAPASSPLIYLIAGFVMLQLTGGAIGLVAGYQSAASLLLRRETFYLIIPTGLVLLGSTIHWIIVLTEGYHILPHELPDALLVLAALFYVQAIIRHGAFVGRPLAGRRLFYSTLSVVVGLIVFYCSLNVDLWLMNYTNYPYPVTTGALVLLLAFGLPDVKRRVKQYLDPRLFKSDQEQENLVYHLVEALAESPDLEQLQAEMLSSLCSALAVRVGFVATSLPTASSDLLTVQVVQGNLALQPGQIIKGPLLHGSDAILAGAALPPHVQGQPPWLNIALICPITVNPDKNGILAIGAKENGQSFSPGEIALCNSLARQLNTLGQMAHLREQRNQFLEAARQQEVALRGLGEQVISLTQQTLAAWADSEPALTINVLGPMQVFNHGKLVSEAEWGSEKAKILLAYLLWKSPDGAARAEISEILWPDRPWDESANVFHVTLHRLRKVLQPARKGKQDDGYIQCERKHYYFNTSLPHRLDVTVFQQSIKSDDPAKVQAAIKLYRGSYLDGLTWALPPEIEIQRRHLERMYTDGLRRLATQTTGPESAAYLERLLVIEPTDEMAHSALVLGYLARGRGDLARQQVVRWQQSLIEIDGEPSPETWVIWEKANSKSGG